MKKIFFPVVFFGIIGGCSGLVVDPSLDAVQAGDFTLAMSACENTPGGGFDICRVRSGTKIESSWKMVIPQKGDAIQGFEVDVYYRDAAQAVHYTGVGSLIEIPWQDFFKQEVWTPDLAGEALALVSVRYLDDKGIVQVVKFKGLAKIVVLAEGYDRLPIDSGFVTWGTTCKIQYTTAGRGAVKCP